jgi:23S rRNA U2552 (ribose-2'-O)-methylase RlmE/FtsJ
MFGKKMFSKKEATNPLLEYFRHNKGNLIHKWLHYFDIYNRHFAKFRNKEVTLLEFGVSHGGSLQMWKQYFGKRARIIGVDINPECQKLVEPQVEIYIGSQEDSKFLKSLMKNIGPVDIVIDDGGHTMLQQLTTFENVYDHVKEGGVYLAEDLHTSYWSEFGGGLRQQGTFIEKAKELVDQLHAWHFRDQKKLKVDDFTRTTESIHFYDSIVVFEKQKVEEPFHEQVGHPTLSNLEEWQYRSKEKKK